MSTRSLTIVYEEKHKREICVFYRHCDGYPRGHGEELREFLLPIKITNSRQDIGTANGAQCLAAQLLSRFKKGPGQFYLYPAGTRDLGEEYIYKIIVNNETLSPIKLICFDVMGKGYDDNIDPMFYERESKCHALFNGLVADFNPEEF